MMTAVVLRVAGLGPTQQGSFLVYALHADGEIALPHCRSWLVGLRHDSVCVPSRENSPHSNVRFFFPPWACGRSVGKMNAEIETTDQGNEQAFNERHVRSADFIERVRVNQQKLTAE